MQQQAEQLIEWLKQQDIKFNVGFIDDYTAVIEVPEATMLIDIEEEGIILTDYSFSDLVEDGHTLESVKQAILQDLENTIKYD